MHLRAGGPCKRRKEGVEKRHRSIDQQTINHHARAALKLSAT